MNLDDTFNRFARTPACREPTDGETYGQIAISRIVFMTKCGRAIKKTDSMCKYQ